MSGTPPVPIVPPEPDRPADDDSAPVLSSEDVVGRADDSDAGDRPLDPDLDDDAVDSAEADERAAKDGTLDPDE